MAMIVCPNCGQPISEKAEKCVHCGMDLVSVERKHCAECGAELEAGAVVCSKCGCPVGGREQEGASETPQSANADSVKPGKRKKIIIAVVILLVVAAAATVGIVQYRKKQAEEEAARISQEYADNLETVTFLMLSGAGDAETCGNLIKQVWYNAIYEERDDATDPYTRPNGVFVSDFNTALSYLFLDSEFSSQIKDIETNQETVKSLMKDLTNPPEEHEEAYEALKEFYDAYLTFTNLVVDPSGSLQTFSEGFNEADSKAVNCYKAMELYLD